jgi:hypothetical protein
MSMTALDHPHMPANQGNTTGFQKGHSRYGGRQKGTRNRLAVTCALKKTFSNRIAGSNG